MNFANIDVKKYITEKGYTQKQIAEKLGITQEWFCRMLKNELADEEKQAVMMAIDGDLRLWRKGHKKTYAKVGQWIVHPKGIYAHLVCSNCLSSAPYDCETNYCPNCGAKMEVE